jgi:hypothetical protein
MYATVDTYDHFHTLTSNYHISVRKRKERFHDGPFVTLMSFANDKYKNGIARIKRQADELPFNRVITYNEKDLSGMPDFWERHHSFIESKSRGYGYWLWKPYLVHKTLSSMKDGEILVYMDAGASLNPNVGKFNDLIKQVSTNKSGIISWELDSLKEKNWTKYDLVEHLDAKSIWDKNMNQLHATFFILRNSESVRNLVYKWYEVGTNYHMIDDSPSKLPNDVRFEEHRHDQSIFSILRRQHGTDVMYNETILRDTKIRS